MRPQKGECYESKLCFFIKCKPVLHIKMPVGSHKSCNDCCKQRHHFGGAMKIGCLLTVKAAQYQLEYTKYTDSRSRSPHGERGLKYQVLANHPWHLDRSLHGGRGLNKINKERSRSSHEERGWKQTNEKNVSPHTR